MTGHSAHKRKQYREIIVTQKQYIFIFLFLVSLQILLSVHADSFLSQPNYNALLGLFNTTALTASRFEQ